MTHNHKESVTIEELYPHLSDAERKEAEANLTRYGELILRIFKRIDTDPEVHRQLVGLLRESQPKPLKQSTFAF